jgi:3-methyl-2-oxobutanoate hydroxymethyltransferase
MLTAYDYPTARLVESAAVDLILVGDSLGMVVLGHTSTTAVTMEDMIRHASAVRRGAPNTHVVVDLPFLTYQVSDEQAVRNAGRMIQEAQVDAVKLEGGRAMASRIRAITRAGIPVMGHIGLLPQTAAGSGGLKLRGRDVDSALAIIADAEAAVDSGAYSIVIEMVPAELAAIITERIPVPTIGIGAGAGCDGQVLVMHDLLGIDPSLQLRMVKRYAELGPLMERAFATYADEVRDGRFPGDEQSFNMKPEVLAALQGALAARNGLTQPVPGLIGSDGDNRS